jgi:hypothetical protein
MNDGLFFFKKKINKEAAVSPTLGLLSQASWALEPQNHLVGPGNRKAMKIQTNCFFVVAKLCTVARRKLFRFDVV